MHKGGDFCNKFYVLSNYIQLNKFQFPLITKLSWIGICEEICLIVMQLNSTRV